MAGVKRASAASDGTARTEQPRQRAPYWEQPPAMKHLRNKHSSPAALIENAASSHPTSAMPSREDNGNKLLCYKYDKWERLSVEYKDVTLYHLCHLLRCGNLIYFILHAIMLAQLRWHWLCRPQVARRPMKNTLKTIGLCALTLQAIIPGEYKFITV